MIGSISVSDLEAEAFKEYQRTKRANQAFALVRDMGSEASEDVAVTQVSEERPRLPIRKMKGER